MFVVGSDSCGGHKNRFRKIGLFFEDPNDIEASSTKVRKMLKSEKSELEKFLHPKVLEYIEKHKLFEKKNSLNLKKLIHDQINNEKLPAN